jgi:putative membrane protein
MDYAKMIETEHQADLDKYQALSEKAGITPPSTAGAVLRTKGAANLAMLMPRNGPGYDKAFVDAMVTDHSQDLDLIDRDLMKDAQNADLKAQLTETRSHVAMHLDKARELQTKYSVH